MSTISITPEGFFVNDHDDEGQPTREMMHPGRVFTHLRSPCTIAEGTTLGDIFYWMDVFRSLKEFIAQYSWCHSIDEFHAQAKLPRVDREGDTIDYLEISHAVDVNQVTEKVKHPSGLRERIQTVYFDTSPDIHGIGDAKSDTDYGLKDGQQVSFSISATPMNEIAHLPIRLNEEFVVHEPFDPSRSNHHREKELLKSTRSFTFLEVLDAIYWDISFYGGPAEANFVMDNLSQRVAEIELMAERRRQWKILADEIDPDVAEKCKSDWPENYQKDLLDKLSRTDGE